MYVCDINHDSLAISVVMSCACYYALKQNGSLTLIADYEP